MSGESKPARHQYCVSCLLQNNFLFSYYSLEKLGPGIKVLAQQKSNTWKEATIISVIKGNNEQVHTLPQVVISYHTSASGIWKSIVLLRPIMPISNEADSACVSYIQRCTGTHALYFSVFHKRASYNTFIFKSHVATRKYLIFRMLFCDEQHAHTHS